MSNVNDPLSPDELRFYESLYKMIKSAPGIKVPAGAATPQNIAALTDTPSETTTVLGETPASGTVGEPAPAPNLNPFGEAQGISDEAAALQPSAAVMTTEESVTIMTQMSNALTSGSFGTVRKILHTVAPLIGLAKGLFGL